MSTEGDAGRSQTSPAGDAGSPRAGDGASAEGGCFCGAIRYRVKLPPLWVAHCHCTMCRRSSAAAFVTWFGVPGDGFAFIGPGDRLRIHRSSADATRSFCGRCGTPLFFESTRWPGQLHVTLASLDPDVAATLHPQVHVHWSDHVPWVELGDELPRKD